MAFRRVHVEKGIRQIAPDRWEVQVHVGRDPDTGKLRQVSRTTRKGIADARRIRARLMTEVSQGKHGGHTVTVVDLLDKWIEHGRQLGRSPNTLTGYRYKAATISRPSKTVDGRPPGLGDVKLTKLTARHVDTWYAAMLASGTTPATLMHYHRVLSAALHQAERWGWVERNVARLAQPPTVPRKGMTVPPPERVRDLIDVAASSRSPEMAAIIMIAALTGLRRGGAVRAPVVRRRLGRICHHGAEIRLPDPCRSGDETAEVPSGAPTNARRSRHGGPQGMLGARIQAGESGRRDFGDGGVRVLKRRRRFASFASRQRDPRICPLMPPDGETGR